MSGLVKAIQKAPRAIRPMDVAGAQRLGVRLMVADIAHREAMSGKDAEAEILREVLRLLRISEDAVDLDYELRAEGRMLDIVGGRLEVILMDGLPLERRGMVDPCEVACEHEERFMALKAQFEAEFPY